MNPLVRLTRCHLVAGRPRAIRWLSSTRRTVCRTWHPPGPTKWSKRSSEIQGAAGPTPLVLVDLMGEHHGIENERRVFSPDSCLVAA